MQSAFRKISRVGSLIGGTKWYLNEDCLLAAKRTMYAVEYRRFYLRDLESVVVWPRRLWLLRLIIPGSLLAALGASLWKWMNSTAGAIFCGAALAWVALELVLGPTAGARIQATGASVELPLVKRTRRAQKVLAEIDAAVRASRGLVEQSRAPASTNSAAGLAIQTRSEISATSSIEATTLTNGS